jgi:hypothetical protein
MYRQDYLRHHFEREFLRGLVLFSRRFQDDSHLRETQQPFEYIISAILALAEKRAAGRNICLFGMGLIGCRIFPSFKNYFGRKLRYVSDNNPDKWGMSFEGLECIAPRELPTDTCVIVSVNPDSLYEIQAQLNNMGLSHVYPYYSLCPEEKRTNSDEAENISTRRDEYHASEGFSSNAHL